jgi:hypothetical protein
MRRVCRSQQDTVYESEQNIEDATAARGPKAVLRLPDVVALKRTSWPLNQRRLPTRQASATIRNYQGKLAMVKSGRIR